MGGGMSPSQKPGQKRPRQEQAEDGQHAQKHAKYHDADSPAKSRASGPIQILCRSNAKLFLHVNPCDGTKTVLKFAEGSLSQELHEIRAIERIVGLGLGHPDNLATGLMMSPALRRPSSQTLSLYMGTQALNLMFPTIPVDTNHVRKVCMVQGERKTALKMKHIQSLPQTHSDRVLQERYLHSQVEHVREELRGDGGSFLMKPLLGKTRGADDPRYGVEVPLASFPGDLGLLEMMFRREFLDKVAGEMAMFLAYLHWGAACRYDGAGVDYLLSGCAGKDGRDVPGVKVCCVGFAKCTELTQWSEDEVSKVMVPAVLQSDAYVPQPGTARWTEWASTYEEVSKILLAQRSAFHDQYGIHAYVFDLVKALQLPPIFIRQLEEALRERAQRRDDDGANPDDDGANPDDDGANPDDDGANPDDDGASPDDDGANPDGGDSAASEVERRAAPNSKGAAPLKSGMKQVHPRPHTQDIAALSARRVHFLDPSVPQLSSPPSHEQCWSKQDDFRKQVCRSIAQDMRRRAGDKSIGVQEGLPPCSIFDGKHEYVPIERNAFHSPHSVQPWSQEPDTRRVVKAGPFLDIYAQVRKAKRSQDRQLAAPTFLRYCWNSFGGSEGIQPAVVPKYHLQGKITTDDVITTDDALWKSGTTLFGMPAMEPSGTEEPSIRPDDINAAGVIFEYPPCHGDVVRKRLISRCYKSDYNLRRVVLDSPWNQACLLKPLFGEADVLPGQPFDETTTLVNFPASPGTVVEVLEDGDRTVLEACQSMGATYALLHWYLDLDGRGLTFLIAGDGRLNVMGTEDCVGVRSQAEKDGVRETFVADVLVRRVMDAPCQLPRPPEEDGQEAWCVEGEEDVDPRSGLFDEFVHGYEATSEVLLKSTENPLTRGLKPAAMAALLARPGEFIRLLTEALRAYYHEKDKVPDPGNPSSTSSGP